MTPVNTPHAHSPGGAPARISVIGEALMDIIHADGADGGSPRVSEHVGGSPLNVAIGCARLGLATRLVTHFGEDAHGRSIAEHLAANGVEAVNGGVGPTSTATATLGADRAATYTFSLTWEIADAALAALASTEDSAHVHTGSIATMLPPGDQTVHSLVQAAQRNATISYDPNCRPSIVGDNTIARRQAEVFVQSSDIVKASDEDLLWLYPNRTLDETLAAWLDAGPALIAVTRGALGPIALTRTARVEMPARAVTVADTVGAGDSFMAALIAGLAQLDLLGASKRDQLRRLDHESLAALIEYATNAAALTCSRPGADLPGLGDLGPMTGTPA
ncbi:carbohydrate kinase [Sinomonas sp. ASV322]|uniref:carbohydrate kinase family protein n=1 Tax=Sinomonas sp. ASV322 TaxID=3041920 RepID=UPI0035A3AD4D